MSAATADRCRDARPGRRERWAAARIARRGAAADEACGRGTPTAPARSATGPQDRAPAAWDCGCRAAAPAGCRSFPSRTARARCAREAIGDQDQAVDIPGFQVRKAGGNRTAELVRQRFPASARLREDKGPAIYIHDMFPSRVSSPTPPGPLRWNAGTQCPMGDAPGAQGGTKPATPVSGQADDPLPRVRTQLCANSSRSRDCFRTTRFDPSGRCSRCSRCSALGVSYSPDTDSII